MLCRRCSAELPAGSTFCNRCGVSQLEEGEPGNGPFSARGAGAQPPEEELWAGRYSLKAAAHLGFLAAAWAVLVAVFYPRLAERTARLDLVALVVALLPGLVALARALLRRFTLRYRLTNQRLFTDRGLLRRDHDELELIRVDDVSVRQNVLQRLFGVGTVRVLSTDASNPELLMEGIVRPLEVKEQLRVQVRARRARTTFLESL
ncbi:MAG TPA: PH domain-containing protein [Planctomycetota bacterium]